MLTISIYAPKSTIPIYPSSALNVSLAVDTQTTAAGNYSCSFRLLCWNVVVVVGVCTNFESTAYAPNKYILGGKQNLSTNEQEQQLTTIIQIRVCLQSVPGRDDIRYGSLCLLVLGETEPDPSCVVC